MSVNLLNYDEYISGCGSGNGNGGGREGNYFQTPGTWQEEWPGLSVAALSTMMSTFLLNTCIVDGGSVCINALEHYMVYRMLSLQRIELCRVVYAANYSMLLYSQVFQTFLILDEDACTNTDKEKSSEYFIIDDFDTPFDISYSSQIENIRGASVSSNNDKSETEIKEVVYIPRIIPYKQSAFDRLSRIMLNSLMSSDFHSVDQEEEEEEERGESTGVWLGPHSGLLMASRGSGKTRLLQDLVASVSAQCTAQARRRRSSSSSRGSLEVAASSYSGRMPNQQIYVFILSGECTSTSTSTSEDNSRVIPSSEDVISGSPQHMFCMLQQLVDALPSSGSDTMQENHSYELQLQEIFDYMSETERLPSVCVVIDNADSLIAASEDSTAQSKLATFFLQQFLALLSVPVCVHPICLIAATSLTLQMDVAPMFRGPPGFETTVTMPLPNYVDRCLLLKCFFESGCGSEDLASVFGELPLSFSSLSDPIHEGDTNENNSNGDGDSDGDSDSDSDDDDVDALWSETVCVSRHVFHWIGRAASLTAGYLPVDLKNIIKRAIGLSSGRRLSPGPGSEGKGADLAFSRECQLEWADFLTALTATTPQQLRSVAISEGGGGGGIVVESRDSSLSWNQFAGYTAQKEAISQILERSNPLYSNKLSVLRRKDRSKGKGKDKSRSELALAVGHHAPKGLVLHGPSGCGKSHMARIIAAEVSGRPYQLIDRQFL
jgi:hypothetical protein